MGVGGDETCSQPGLALSARAVGSVFEGVFDLVSSLFGVARELIDASLGAQAGVAGGAAEVLLGGALGGFGLVRDLLTDAHCGFLRSVIGVGCLAGSVDMPGARLLA